MSDVRIWRMYPNGEVKDETRVLWRHAGGTGYNGDVSEWSRENQKFRPGCAQVVQKGDAPREVIYQGSVCAKLTDAFIADQPTGATHD